MAASAVSMQRALIRHSPSVLSASTVGKRSLYSHASTVCLAVSSRPLGLSSSFLPPKRTLQIAIRQGQTRRFSVGNGARASASNPEQLKGAQEAVKELIKSKNCNPILIRLGWHDAGTFDKDVKEFPIQGGANGSIRFVPEKGHAANRGLDNALKLLEPIVEKYPNVSYADLFQMASATAVELAGGPQIDMKYGRVDSEGEKACPKEGNLPEAAPPNPAEHLRKVFYRMGFNDQEIVALSGAHTLGRSYPGRSGFGKAETKYTKNGPGNPGGQSWTVDWLKFDNSYFKDIIAKTDEELLVLPTDAVLVEDESFKVYAEKYAADQDLFFSDYAKAHKKLSELGSKFDPPEGIKIDAEPAQPVAEKFSAAKYSSGA